MKSLLKLLPSVLFLIFIITLILLADIKGTEYLLRMIPKVPHGDKIGHFILFGFLAFLVNFGFEFRSVSLFKRAFYLGSLIIFAFATVEECSQIFLSTRSFDLIDLAADLGGIWLFSHHAFRAFLVHWFQKFRMPFVSQS